MFEKILEKILLSYFGKFISGFDQKNLQLGVWSGNVVIENVSLKPDVFGSLELPLKIKFSSLGRLNIKIPWNKLSSAPVEVILEDILVVFMPLEEQFWNIDDSIQIQRKFNKLLQRLRQQIQIRKNAAENSGYFEKLTLKIIDNLQVSLKNIHFRYEDINYSWGIKLNSLTALTTNEQFIVQFVDRADSETKQLPRNKLIELQELSIYWNSKETIFLTSNNQQFNIDEIINISATCQLIINSKEVFDKSHYCLQMQLEEINLNLKHTQLTQVIKLLETITHFNNKIWSQKQNKLQQNQDDYNQQFKDLLLYILKNDIKDIEQLGDQEELLKSIISNNNMQQLNEWSIPVIKQYLLDIKVLELQKQKSKKGWFNFLGNNSQEEVTEQEVKQLEEFIAHQELSKVTRPSESRKIKFISKLKSINISLVKDNKSLIDEGIVLGLENVSITLDQFENQDFSFAILIQNIGLQLINSIKREQILIPNKQITEFISLYLTKTTNVQFCRLDLRFLMQSITVNYNPSIVRIIREILKVKQGDFLEQSLKTATQAQIEKIQDSTSSSLQKILEQNIQLKIDIKILEPILELPISSHDYWYFKTESINIRSKNNSIQDLYENFEISMNKGSFQYFPEKHSNQQLHIVDNYNFGITIQRVKSIHKEEILKEKKSLIIISARLEPFQLILNENIYKKLIYLPETIYPKQTEEQILQQLQQEKQLIVKYQIKSSILKRCGNLIRTWNQQYAILSQSYLYFYDQEQTLMANSQINLCNSIIQKIYLNDQNFTFKISNRSGEHIFACNNKNEFDDWFDKITQQIELSQLEIDKKPKVQTAIFTTIDISIRKISLKLYKGDHYPSTYQEYLLFLFKLNNIHFLEEKLEKTSRQISIDNLSLQDWIFDFTNPQYQDLMVLSGNDDKKSLIIQINYKQINIDVCQLDINWKPDTFLKIRELIQIVKNRKSRKWYFASVQDYEVDQLKRGSNCDYEEMKKQKLIEGLKNAFNKCQKYGTSKLELKQKFFTLIDHEKFIEDIEWIHQNIYKFNTNTLLELNTSIQKMNIHFFHRTSHCLLFKCNLQDVGFKFIQLQNCYYLDTFLKDITLYEMTNYPFTLDSNIDFEQIQQKPLIEKQEKYDDEMVRFRFSGYDEILIANKDRINMFLYIEINPVVAIYQHQPIMRWIDYIINQIVTLIKEPDALTMNAEYARKKKLKKDFKAKRVWGEVDQIQQKFICPTFIDLRISIKKPVIIIKGWPQFQEYFQLNCQNIEIYNKQYIDLSRLKQEGGKLLIQSNQSWMPDGRILTTWSEAYCIEGHGIQLQYFDKQVNQISTPFELNLSFERVLHYFEIRELYDNVEMDRSIRIKSALSQLIFKFYREEYLQLCRMIFHNFTNDDLKDKWYIHDFEVSRSFEPAPIIFYLDFENVSIFALSHKQQQPLIQVNFQFLRLEWLKNNHIDLNLFGKQITMYHYDENFNEIGFVGELCLNNGNRWLIIKDLLEQQQIKQNKKQNIQFNIYSLDEDFSIDSSQFVLLFHINKPSSDKECTIQLKNLRMIVEPTVFTNIGLWSRLESICWPVQEEFGEMPSIKLIAEIINCSLCLQGLKSDYILATKGDISYVWNRSRFLHPEQIIKNLQKDILDKKAIEAIGDAFEHKINLKNLELFKCRYDDFILLDLLQVRKRHLILPFSLFFCKKNELHVEYSKQYIYYSNKYSFHIDKTICKISYQDIVLVMSITDNLKSSKLEVIREPIYDQPIEQNQIIPINNMYDAIISGLQIVVINDAGEAYVPVFDLTLSETQLQFQQTNQKSIFSTVIKLNSSFYNPKIAVWEPIVESCNFSIDVSLNPHGDPQKIIFVEMIQENQVLNINLSVQMITVFHKTLLSWKREMDESKKNPEIEVEQKSFEKVDNYEKSSSDRLQVLEKQLTLSKQFSQQGDDHNKVDNIDYVSPYTIRNETGFVLEIYDSTNTNKKYILQNNTSINYEIDAEFDQVFARDWEDIQQQQQRLITLRVIHSIYQFDYAQSIDLDCIRVNRFPLKPLNRGMDRTFMLFVEVVPKDTRKLLLISSETILLNKTNQTIELKLFEINDNQECNIQQSRVESQRAFSIPIDRTRSYLSFRFEGDQKFSQQIDMRYLADNENKMYEQKHDEFYTLVKCGRRNVNQNLIYLEAPFQIKNCLPIDISYEVFGDIESQLADSIVQIPDFELSKMSNQSKFTITPVKLLDKMHFEHLHLREKGIMIRQEQKQLHSISSKGRLAIKIKLPFYQISDMCMLNHTKFGVFTIDNIQLCDYRGNVGYINVQQIKNIYYIYCNQVVINELPFKIYCYNVQEVKKGITALIPGQKIKDIITDEKDEESNIILLNDLQQLSLSVIDNCTLLSETINLNYTGNQTIKIQNELNQIIEIGYNISLMCVDKLKPLVTKVITLSPRFVILNQTSNTIEIIQEEYSIQIKSLCRAPMYWNSQRYQYIQISYLDQFLEWLPSNAIDPNATGFQCFTIRQVNNLTMLKHFNCVSKRDNQILYLIITECKQISKQINPSIIEQKSIQELLVDPPYVIVNNIELVTLTCYQFCCSQQQYNNRYSFGEYKQYIQNYQQCAFSWEYPCERRDLVIEMKFEGELSTQFKSDPIYINLEEVEALQEYIVNSQQNEHDQFKFYIMSLWEGASRKLKFVQDVQNQQQHETNILKLDINLTKVGLSLIEQQKNKRLELIYIYFQGLEFSLLQTTQSKRSEFKIKYINIDDTTSYKTMFPVIFTPTKYKEIFEFNRPHLSLLLEQSTQVKSISLIKNIRACLQPTTIRLTSEMMESLYFIFKQISQSFKSNLDESSKQFDFEYAINFDDQQVQNINMASLSNKVQIHYGVGSLGIENIIEWQQIDIQLNESVTYINKIEIYPLKFNLTFYSSAQSKLQYNVFMQILKTIGIVMGNIDEAPLILDGIFLENSFDTSSSIIAKVGSHYQDKLFQIFLKILGSIEIIGNPIGLVKHLARGVYDLFDKPIEGFIKGPIEGGIGIAKGAGSLVQNTVSGVSNSTSKIAGSFSGGLAAISCDKQYKQEREPLKIIKPNQIFSGIFVGSKLLQISVKRAIVGVVDIPIKKTKKKGVKGLAVGVLEGTAGFFIKPFAGMFDFVCKTTDGLKATAQYWDDKANDKRIRQIRVIYQSEQFYKAYNEKDAQVMEFLISIYNKAEDYYYYDSFEIESEIQIHLLVLTYQQFIFIDQKKKKIIWSIDPSTIQDVQMIEDGILFQLKQFNDKYNAQQIQLQVSIRRLKEIIILKSQWMLSNI